MTDRLSLTKETYDQVVERRNAAISAVDSCRWILSDARFGVEAAQKQLNEAVAADEEINRKIVLATNRLEDSLEEIKSYRLDLDRFVAERIKTHRTRAAAADILKRCREKVEKAEEQLAKAEHEFAEQNEEIAKVSKDIGRYTNLT